MYMYSFDNNGGKVIVYQYQDNYNNVNVLLVIQSSSSKLMISADFVVATAVKTI